MLSSESILENLPLKKNIYICNDVKVLPTAGFNPAPNITDRRVCFPVGFRMFSRIYISPSTYDWQLICVFS